LSIEGNLHDVLVFAGDTNVCSLHVICVV